MSSTPTGSPGASAPTGGPGASAPTGEVLVGVVARAHSLRGEVAVDVHTDEPDARFAVGAVLRVRRRGVPDATVTVESARPHSGRFLVRFVEAPDRTAAEGLRGARLLLTTAQLPPPGDPEEFHVHQLIGLTVELLDGSPVGTVRDVVHGPGAELLVLTPAVGEGEPMVPFVRAIVPVVDLAGRRIVLDPPDGLLDPPA